MKLIYTGDWHIRGTSPRNRKDDYKEALKTKLREVFALAKEHEARAIIAPGDIFDRPEVATAVLLEFADLLLESPVPIYATSGNHDLYGYNVDSYWKTSLALLERLVPQLIVTNDPSIGVHICDPDQPVVLTFMPYNNRIDRDGYGYSPEVNNTGSLNIHIAHGILLDHTPPFDRFTLIQEVQTTADLVLTGHDHTGYGIYRRSDGKTFVNPGSLTRMAASVAELERQIQVLLIDVRAKNYFDLKLIPLKSAALGQEVLDRSGIEATQARQYAMEEFAALIQNRTGEKVLLNIPDIVETIAAQEGLAPEVVATALKKINEARG